MLITVSYLLTRALLTLGAPAPSPGHVQARRQGDQSDPYTVWFDCTGTEAVCDADCMAIYCFYEPNPVQKDATGASDGNRKDAGFDIFKKTEDYRKKHGVTTSDQTLAITGNSGEETVMAMNKQSGMGEIVVPVEAAPNSLLGSRVKGQVTREGIKEGDWYYKRFKNYGTLAPYCSGLETGSPKRDDVCKAAGKDPEDPVLNAATRDWSKPHDNGRFDFHMMEYPKDKWQQGGWGAGGSSKSKRATGAGDDVNERGQDHEASD